MSTEVLREIPKARFILEMFELQKQVSQSLAMGEVPPQVGQAKLLEIEGEITTINIAEAHDLKVRCYRSESGELYYEIREKGKIGFALPDIKVRKIEPVKNIEPVKKERNKKPERVVIPKSSKEDIKKDRLRSLAYEISATSNPQLFGIIDSEENREIQKNRLKELKEEMEKLLSDN